MRILFSDLSCARPSLTCAFVNGLSFDSDDGNLWFEFDGSIYEISVSEGTAIFYMRTAMRDGFVDLTSLGLFHSVPLD